MTMVPLPSRGVLSRIWEFETILASWVSLASLKNSENTENAENAEIVVNAKDIEDAKIVSISQILDMYLSGTPDPGDRIYIGNPDGDTQKCPMGCSTLTGTKG